VVVVGKDKPLGKAEDTSSYLDDTNGGDVGNTGEVPHLLPTD
jgi:hypothetical protein